jgi:hypothetical protein
MLFNVYLIMYKIIIKNYRKSKHSGEGTPNPISLITHSKFACAKSTRSSLVSSTPLKLLRAL